MQERKSMIRALAVSLLTQRLRRFRKAARRSSPSTALVAQVRIWVRKNAVALLRQEPATQVGITVMEASVPIAQAITEHLASLVQKRLSRLSETRHFEVAADPVDAIHDLRVASRRLRAFVDVFEPLLDTDLGHRAKRPLKSITRAARAARDSDVQLGLLRQWFDIAGSDVERAALEDLIAHTEEQRRGDIQRLRKRLKRLNWKDIDIALAAVLGTAVTRIPSSSRAMTRLTWQLLEPLVSLDPIELGRQAGHEPAAQLHEFRIQLKKLRYALELFEPVLGPAFDALYDPIESLQDLLGQHHDLVVLEDFLRRHRKELEQEQRVTLARAVADLERKLTERRRAAFEKYRERAFDLVGWQQALRAQLGQRSPLDA